MPLSNRLVACLVFLATVLASQQAFAQTIITDEDEMMTSTTTFIGLGVTALVGIGAAITVATRPDPKRDREMAVKRYLDQNEPAVREALVLGGPAVEDLAFVLNLDPAHVPALGQWMREKRELFEHYYQYREPYWILEAFDSWARGGYVIEEEVPAPEVNTPAPVPVPETPPAPTTPDCLTDEAFEQRVRALDEFRRAGRVDDEEYARLRAKMEASRCNVPAP